MTLSAAFRFGLPFLVFAPGLAVAQTPDLVLLFKVIGVEQTSSAASQPHQPGYGAMVTFPLPVSASTTVQFSGPATATVPRLTSQVYYLDRYYLTDAELDQALPDGNYTLRISGGGAPASIPITLPPPGDFRPSLFTNFNELQAWPESTVRFTWQPIAGTTSFDSLQFKVLRADGKELYVSPGPGERGPLASTATSISVPGLPANETLIASLTYIRFNFNFANGLQTVTMGGRGFNVRVPFKIVPGKPVFTRQPQAQTVASGSTVVFSAEASGNSLTYQWRRNGVPLAGETNSIFILRNAPPSSAGFYTLDAINAGGTVTSDSVALSIDSAGLPGRITNLAIRTRAGSAAETLIVGFAIGPGGSAGSKAVLVRGIGPTLSVFDVPGALADPKLELYSGPTKMSENDDWGGSAQIAAVAASVGAFALSSATSRDAAIYHTNFTSGAYSVQLTGAAGSAGVALAEIYDAGSSASGPRLVNVSARSRVGTGADLLIAGFTISGSRPTSILIRAVGPTLGVFGVQGSLADPGLELYGGAAKLLDNDNWGGLPSLTATFASAGAFSLGATTKDAALVVTLPPGSYTAQVSGVGNTTGVALIEIYEVP